MPLVPVYNQEGQKVSEHQLSDAVFGVPVKPHVVASVVEALRANSRRASAHTKHRGEVRGGGKKPWRQKGTGRARAGSIRSPLWRGGGVIFGPRNERNPSIKVNAKMKTAAMRMCLSDKVNEGRLLLLEGLTLPEVKTRALQAILKRVLPASGMTRQGQRTLLLTNEQSVGRAARNLKTVTTVQLDGLNVLTLLSAQYLLATTVSVRSLEERFTPRV